jgi:LemA protein
MKSITTLVILGIVAIVLLLGCNGYNGIVKQDESVKKAWNNVEAEYQNRADLVDNLVSTVKGAADFEQQTLTAVVEARAKATSVNINADNLTPEKIAEFQAAQGQLARNLGLTSLDIQGRGLAAIPSVQGTAQNWQQLARAFTAEPLDVGRLQLGYGTAQADIGLQKARMTSDMYSNIANAQLGLASQIYGANKENIGASFASQQALGQGIGQVGQAASGAFMGMAQASALQQGLYGGVGAGAGGGSQSITGAGGKQFIPSTSASGNLSYKPVTPF